MKKQLPRTIPFALPFEYTGFISAEILFHICVRYAPFIVSNKLRTTCRTTMKLCEGGLYGLALLYLPHHGVSRKYPSTFDVLTTKIVLGQNHAMYGVSKVVSNDFCDMHAFRIVLAKRSIKMRIPEITQLVTGFKPSFNIKEMFTPDNLPDILWMMNYMTSSDHSRFTSVLEPLILWIFQGMQDARDYYGSEIHDIEKCFANIECILRKFIGLLPKRQSMILNKKTFKNYTRFIYQRMHVENLGLKCATVFMVYPIPGSNGAVFRSVSHHRKGLMMSMIDMGEKLFEVELKDVRPFNTLDTLLYVEDAQVSDGEKRWATFEFYLGEGNPMYVLSTFQLQFLEKIKMALAPSIHGKDWSRVKERFCKERGWKDEDLNRFLLGMAPRRFGKSVLVGGKLMFAYMMAMPGEKVAGFSTGRRASKATLDLARNVINASNIRILKSNDEEIVVLHPFTKQETKLSFFPSNPRVSFLLLGNIE
jgi:hypothetical protein